jgi:cysteine synthase A
LNGQEAQLLKVCPSSSHQSVHNPHSGIGIGQGRVTKNLATFVDELSGAFTVPDTKSIAMLYELLDTEGLYVGTTSALNVVAAVELAEKLGKGIDNSTVFLAQSASNLKFV